MEYETEPDAAKKYNDKWGFGPIHLPSGFTPV